MHYSVYDNQGLNHHTFQVITLHSECAEAFLTIVIMGIGFTKDSLSALFSRAKYNSPGLCTITKTCM